MFKHGSDNDTTESCLGPRKLWCNQSQRSAATLQSAFSWAAIRLAAVIVINIIIIADIIIIIIVVIVNTWPLHEHASNPMLIIIIFVQSWSAIRIGVAYVGIVFHEVRISAIIVIIPDLGLSSLKDQEPRLSHNYEKGRCFFLQQSSNQDCNPNYWSAENKH